MNKISFILVLLLILSLVACNLPTGQQATSSSPDAANTAAAQTVAAELTKIAGQVSPTPTVPTNTTAPTLTNTPVPTITNTPIPCNLAGFIADVTYPDHTQVAAGLAFTKTWRLRNIGTCTWTSAYTVVFDHGDGMGVPAGYTQPLTSGTIPPGGTVDISVNLTAPTTVRSYTGNWHLREPGGQPFGTNFIVVIDVVSAPITVTLSPQAGESGTVRSDAGPFPDFTAGESNADMSRTCEAFLSFDITGIPSNATITEVKVNLTAYTTEGNPFGSLGVLNMYLANFGLSLTPAAYVSGFPPGNVADWGSTGALNNIEASPELKAALQSKVGASRLQLRLQFAGANGDAVKDRVTFTNPTLVVTYTKP